MTEPKELYACVYATEFPAQALLRLRPELRDKPCVVMNGEPPLQLVCSLTRKARLLGLNPGMTKVEVETFPAVTILRRSIKEEAVAKAALLECTGTFSPRVEAKFEDVAFLCAIDIAGTVNLFGQPETLAKNLLSRVRSLGITACITISHNFHAALAFAKGMQPQYGIRVINFGQERSTLGPLPLSVLDMSEEQTETFVLWGIRTLGMLASLPEKELVARMGQAGRHLRKLACGEMPHLFQPVEPAFSLVEQMELDSTIEDHEALLFIVNVMLEQIICRVNARALALSSVSIFLSLEEGMSHARIVRPALPTNDKQLWIRLIRLDLQSHPPHAAILAVLITAEPGTISNVQLGLFSPQLPEAARLDVTLARIRGIVGDENVGRAVLTDTHQPDGFRLEQFTITPGSASITPYKQTHLAIRKIRSAENISVTAQNQQPKALSFRNKRYVVEYSYGPWLTSGDWWNSNLWGLEQWDIEARAHDNTLLRCCVVRYQGEDHWRIAALYD